MTLRMGDGPVANLPPELDAYAGYVNESGIGATYPDIVTLAKKENAIPFSITTNGSAQAKCADVEEGAMKSWRGYYWGYCSVSMVNQLVKADGRPKRLWTAHYDPKFGAHICGPKTCNYGADQGNPLVTTADGTQWTNHGGAWDESLLNDNFFTLVFPVTIPQGVIKDMQIITINGTEYLVSNIVASGHLVQIRQVLSSVGSASTSANTSIIDLTDQWPSELSNVTAS